MRGSVADVLGRLRAEGLASEATDAAAREALRSELADDMPWFLRAIVGFAAWVATAFLLFSLVAIAGLKNEIIRGALGAAMIAGAAGLRRSMPGEFFRWAAVAIALAGQGLIAASVVKATDSPMATALVCLAVSVLLIVWIRDSVLSFLSTVAGAAALIGALVDAELPHGFDVATLILLGLTAWVWRVDLTRREERLEETLVPVGYGLIVSLFGTLLVRTMAVSGHSTLSLDVGRGFAELGPLATIGATVALLLLAWKILDEHGVALNGPRTFAILLGAVALGVGTLDSPGVVAGVAALALAFDRRNRVLLLMAIVFLLTFLALYYYSLHLTLLQKSGVLAGSGALLLGIRGRIASRNA